VREKPRSRANEATGVTVSWLANESRCMRVFATIKMVNEIVEAQERKQNSQIRWKIKKRKKKKEKK